MITYDKLVRAVGLTGIVVIGGFWGITDRLSPYLLSVAVLMAGLGDLATAARLLLPSPSGGKDDQER